MTSHHPVRRLLARTCSADTMARIVDPILADMRWERRPQALGYVALAHALAVHAMMSLPDVLHRASSEDGRAILRMGMLTIAAALLWGSNVICLAIGLLLLSRSGRQRSTIATPANP